MTEKEREYWEEYYRKEFEYMDSLWFKLSGCFFCAFVYSTIGSGIVAVSAMAWGKYIGHFSNIFIEYFLGAMFVSALLAILTLGIMFDGGGCGAEGN